jgi:ATP-dependent DNA helicase RecG
MLITPYQLSEDTRKRIEIMTATCDGFEIAEADLKLRGPGDLEGTQQSGMAFDLKIANLARDGALIEHVREIAKEIIADDPELARQENVLMGRMLRRLKKSQFDWSSIS